MPTKLELPNKPEPKPFRKPLPFPELKTRNVSYSWVGYPVREVQLLGQGQGRGTISSNTTTTKKGIDINTNTNTNMDLKRCIHKKSRFSVIIWSGSGRGRGKGGREQEEKGELMGEEEQNEEDEGEGEDEDDEVLILELRTLTTTCGSGSRHGKGHGYKQPLSEHVVEFSRCSKKGLNPSILETSQWAGTTSWSLLAIVNQATQITERGLPYKGTTLHLFFDDHQSFLEELVQVITMDPQPSPFNFISTSTSTPASPSMSRSISKTNPSLRDAAGVTTGSGPKFKIIRNKDILADSVWTKSTPPTLAVPCTTNARGAISTSSSTNGTITSLHDDDDDNDSELGVDC